MEITATIKKLFETKYRIKLVFQSEYTGEYYSVECRPWYIPYYKQIAKAHNAEEITKIVNKHKKRIVYI